MLVSTYRVKSTHKSRFNPTNKEFPAMFSPKGKFGWYELMTTDTTAAGKFYSDVVGWTTQNVGSPDMPYITFNVNGFGIAGMLTIPGHTAWIGYISVEDVDTHVEKIVETGGKLWKGPTDVPGMLRFAVVSDPQGAAFVVFTPNPAMPTPVDPPKPPTPGTIGWSELNASDVDSAWDFYSKLFGWTIFTDMDMGPMGNYRVFSDGDPGKTMGAGGFMTKAPEIPNAHWGFYIQVESIKAASERITSGGGKILMGPLQVPGGGWIIMCLDPFGAAFNLISSKE
jgi:predicted enzyme related to lactoylglutathione lyase